MKNFLVTLTFLATLTSATAAEWDGLSYSKVVAKELLTGGKTIFDNAEELLKIAQDYCLRPEQEREKMAIAHAAYDTCLYYGESSDEWSAQYCQRELHQLNKVFASYHFAPSEEQWFKDRYLVVLDYPYSELCEEFNF